MIENNSNHHIIIDSSQLQKEYFRDLFRYRELFFFLAWRDVIVRYRQALLGVVWSLVRPLLNMVVFVLVFGKMAALPSEGVPYALYVLAGLVPWQLFSSNLVDGSQSLLSQSQLVSKIYFPRLILPCSSMIPNFLDFMISLTMLFAAAALYGYFGWTLLLVPLLICLLFFLSLAVSLWTSALMVRYRDIRFIVPFVVQFGLFISPVGYGSVIVPAEWRVFYYLNPMAGVIDGFRYALYGVGGQELTLSLGMSVAVTLAILVSGFNYFRALERQCADII